MSSLVKRNPESIKASIKKTRQVAFLAAFAEFGTVTKACQAAGINTYTGATTVTTGSLLVAGETRTQAERLDEALRVFIDKIGPQIQKFNDQGKNTKL